MAYRKKEITELLERLERGPASLSEGCSKEDYDIWVRTWIIPSVKNLIPELRSQSQNMRKEKGGQEKQNG